MRKRINVLLIVLVCLAYLTAPALAQVQGNARLATLDIAVWPEYDQPAVLVIYYGQIAVDVPLPANVFIRIPASVVEGKPHAVAGNDPAQGLINLPYTVTEQNEWLLLSFTTAYSTFQVEFYDALDTTRPERNYTLIWSGDMAVDVVAMQVQEPFNASDFHVTPLVEEGQRKDDGLVYYPAKLGSLQAGQTVAIELSYNKADSRTSVEALSLTVAAPVPQPAPTPSGSFPLPAWMVVGIVVGAGLIVAGVIWYLYSGRQEAPTEYVASSARRKRGRRNVRQHAVPRSERGEHKPWQQEEEYEEEAAFAVFCTQCGQPLRTADVFCSQCGARRRSS